MGQRQKQPVYDSIQVMRGMAALLVLGIHVSQFWWRLSSGSTRVWWNGSVGVDIFFVISGLVMMISTDARPMGTNAARDFLLRRALRLLPMYWLATMLYAAEYLLVGRFPNLATPAELYPGLNMQFLLTSLFLLPYHIGGYTLPVAAVGWTLRFECFFYIAFALALAIRVKPQYFLTATLLPLGLALEYFLGKHFTDTPLLLIEFLLGIWLFVLVSRLRFVVPAGVSVVLALAASVALMVPKHGLQFRCVRWGIPAFILIGTLMLLDRKLNVRWPRVLMLIGDASYSLYLLHIFVFCCVCRLLQALGFAGRGNTSAASAVVLIVSCYLAATACGILAYKKIELPLNNALRRRFLQGERLQAQANS